MAVFKSIDILSNFYYVIRQILIFYGSAALNQTQATITVINQNPAMAILKVPSPTTYSSVGATITYNYTVTNTGNVDLPGPINVTENRTGLSSVLPSGLSVGESEKVQSANGYQIKQVDLDNGQVTNSTYAIGIFNSSLVVSETFNATVNATQSPALNITKVASPSSYDHVKELITYTYTLNNTGNVDIPEPITVHDNKILGGQITIGTSGSMLAPGQNVTGTGTYAITQADLDAGFVTNSAFATNNIINSNNTSVTVLAIQKPNLKIDKDVDPKTYFT